MYFLTYNTSGVGLQTEQVSVFAPGSHAGWKGSWDAGTETKHLGHLSSGSWICKPGQWGECQGDEVFTVEPIAPLRMLPHSWSPGSLRYFGTLSCWWWDGIIWLKYSVSSHPFLWVELSPLPNSCVEFLTPGTSGCDFIWKQGHYRCN